MRLLSIFSLCLFLTASAFSQNNFEGSLNFKVSVSGEKVEDLKSTFPDKINMKVKGKKMLVKTTGGQISELFSGYIFDGETQSFYLLSPALETAMKLSSSSSPGNDGEHKNVEIEKTGASQTLAGHKCEEYIIKETEGKKGTIRIWATEDFSIEKPSNLGNLTGNMFMQGISGVPLKVVTNQQGSEISMEVTEVRKQSIDASNFEIPTGYRVQDIDFQLLSAMLPGLNY